MYENGICPECLLARKTIKITYKTKDPLHNSKYILNQIEKLNVYIKELEDINAKIKNILKEKE